jgi:hypothetical protein
MRIRTPLLFVLSVVSCSGEAPPPEAHWAGHVDTMPGGVIAVSNPATGAWPASYGWRLEQDLRLGSLDGGMEEFESVWDLAVDDWGRIYVLLTRSHEIRLFDARGEFIRSVGRDGAGPGEFRFPRGLALDPQSRLWVRDGNQARYVVFDSTGKFLFARPTGMGSAGGTAKYVQFDRAGNLYDGELRFLDARRAAYRFFTVDSLGSKTDTLSVPLPPRPSDQPMVIPFNPRPSFSVTPDGNFWVTLNQNYELALLTSSGDTLRVVQKESTPVRLSASEQDSARLVIDRFWKRIGSGEKLDLVMPETKPPVHNLTVDDDGYVWVAATAGSQDETSRHFDIFDPDGRFLGQASGAFDIWVHRLSAPPMDPSPLLIKAGNLYATMMHEDGFVQVLRARIRK